MDREDGEVLSDDECQIIEIKTYSAHDIRWRGKEKYPYLFESSTQSVQTKKEHITPTKDKYFAEPLQLFQPARVSRFDAEPAKVSEVALDSRNSEDMDISPVNSINNVEMDDSNPGFVLEVNSPLDSSPDQTSEQLILPNSEQTNEQEPPAAKKQGQKRRKKKFSKKFLEGVKNLLLDGLADDMSESSDTDFEMEDKVKELRFQLSFHYKELQDAVAKRNALSKELQKCDCVIAHHQETIGDLEKKISTQSNDLVKEYRGKSRRKKRKYDEVFKDFQSRVDDLMSQLSGLDRSNEDILEKEVAKEAAASDSWRPVVDKPAFVVENPFADISTTVCSSSSTLLPLPPPPPIIPPNIPVVDSSGNKKANLLTKEEELRQKLMSKKIQSPAQTKRQKLTELHESAVNGKENVPAFKAEKRRDKSKEDVKNLFDFPLTAIRSFILDPFYPIKESIERLRCNIDPNIPLCYYELFGYCGDPSCADQHMKSAVLSDQQLLEEILSFIPGRKMFPEPLDIQAANLLRTKKLENIVADLRREVQDFDFIQLAFQGCG